MAGNLTDRWEEEGPVVSADKECSATYIYLGRPPIPVRIQRVFLLTRESSTLGEGLASDDGKVIGRDSRDWRERTRMKNGEWRVNQHWRTRRKLKHRYQEKLKSYKWIDFSLLMKSKEEGRKEVRKEGSLVSRHLRGGESASLHNFRGRNTWWENGGNLFAGNRLPNR